MFLELEQRSKWQEGGKKGEFSFSFSAKVK
jgi:hypothetical protein